MKFFNKPRFKKVLPIVLILAPFLFIYWPSLFNPFFQDDFLLLGLSRLNGIEEYFQSFIPIPEFPYRPFATHWFYYLMQTIFDLNYVSYHLVTSIWFLFNSLLVYLILKQLFKKQTTAWVGTFIYAISATHYMTLFWIATAYFFQGTTFFLSSFYLFTRYLNKRKIKTYSISILLFVIATLFNEATITLPFLLTFYLILVKKNFVRHHISTLPFYLISSFSIVFRLSASAKPKLWDYQYSFTFQTFLSSFKWYFLRTLSLPEGIGFVPYRNIIYLFFFIFLTLTLYLSIKTSKLKHHLRNLIRFQSCLSQKTKLTVFGFLWFVTGTSIFLFLPNHMSSYYLEISTIGTVIIILALIFPTHSKNTHPKIDYLLFIVCYFFLSLVSVRAMQKTHWVSRRGLLAKNLITQLQTQCNHSKIVKPVTLLVIPDQLDEAKIVLDQTTAVNLYCNHTNVTYKTK